MISSCNILSGNLNTSAPTASPALDMTIFTGGSFAISMGAKAQQGVTASFAVQASNDEVSRTANPAALVTTWATIPNSVTVLSASLSKPTTFFFDFGNFHGQWARLLVTTTSGTGSLDSRVMAKVHSA